MRLIWKEKKNYHRNIGCVNEITDSIEYNRTKDRKKRKTTHTFQTRTKAESSRSDMFRDQLQLCSAQQCFTVYFLHILTEK